MFRHFSAMYQVNRCKLLRTHYAGVFRGLPSFTHNENTTAKIIDSNDDLSDHPSDDDVAGQMKCKQTCGNYSKDSKIHINKKMEDDVNHCDTCNCHINKKMEDDVNHCNTCFENILQRLENAILLHMKLNENICYTL